MMKHFFATAILTLTSSVSWAQPHNFKSDLSLVTRMGEQSMRVIYNLWSSEYPGPVLDVNSKNKSGSTKITAYRFIQNPESRISCTIANGLYHPWSTSDESARGYLTVAPHLLYRSLVVSEVSTFSYGPDHTVLEKAFKIPKNSLISELAHLSEGYCNAKVKSQDPNTGKTSIILLESIDCSTFENTAKFQDLTTTLIQDSEYEQWIEVKCLNGERAFVQDTELLKVDGVREGEITGYGGIGPAQP